LAGFQIGDTFLDALRHFPSLLAFLSAIVFNNVQQESTVKASVLGRDLTKLIDIMHAFVSFLSLLNKVKTEGGKPKKGDQKDIRKHYDVTINGLNLIAGELLSRMKNQVGVMKTMQLFDEPLKAEASKLPADELIRAALTHVSELKLLLANIKSGSNSDAELQISLLTTSATALLQLVKHVAAKESADSSALEVSSKELTKELKYLALSLRADLLDADTVSQLGIGEVASKDECVIRVDSTVTSVSALIEKLKLHSHVSKQNDATLTRSSILQSVEMQQVASLLDELRIQQYRRCSGEENIAVTLQAKQTLQQSTAAYVKSLAQPQAKNVEIIASLKGTVHAYAEYFERCNDAKKCTAICTAWDSIYHQSVDLLASADPSQRLVAQQEIAVSIANLNNTLFDTSTAVLKQIKSFSNTLQALSLDINAEPQTVVSPRLPTLPPLPQFPAKRELPSLPQPPPTGLSSATETVSSFSKMPKADQAVELKKMLQQMVGSAMEFVELESKPKISAFIAQYPTIIRATSQCCAAFFDGNNKEVYEAKLQLINQALLKYTHAVLQVILVHFYELLSFSRTMQVNLTSRMIFPRLPSRLGHSVRW
jgi:hypothetical protein